MSNWMADLITLTDLSDQVGMHGAGLVNSFFLRSNAAFVEIFPCGIGGSPFFDYYREPHRIQAGVVGISVFITNGYLCVPYQPKPYEQANEGVNHSNCCRDERQVNGDIVACLPDLELQLRGETNYANYIFLYNILSFSYGKGAQTEMLF